MHPLCLTVALSIAAVGHAQTVRVTPSTAYPTPQSAITASAPGDTVEILPGSYFGGFTVARGITIVGGPARFLGPLNVTNVPVGESVRITGMITVALPSGRAGFVARDCAGAVHVSHLTSTLGDSQITNCAFVALNQCSFAGKTAGPTIGSSFVQISGCTFEAPLAALVCTNSNVRVGASSFTGSTGLFSAASGIELNSGTLVLGAGSTVTSAPGNGLTASAISSDGALGLDPSVILTPTGAPPISGTGTTTILAAPSAVIDEFSASRDFAGRVVAPAGVACGILLGLPAPPVPTPFGPFELSGFALAIDSGVVPASGERTFRFPVAGSTPIGFTLSIQAFVNDGTNLYLSTSSTAFLGP